MSKLKPVLVLVLLLGSFQNCGKLSASHTGFESTQGIASFDMVVNQIFTPKCARCHGGFTDFATVTSCSRIIPFKPEESYLYTAVTAGTMPPCGDHLNSYQLELLRAWIEGGALSSQGYPPPAIQTPCAVPLKATPSVAIMCN